MTLYLGSASPARKQILEGLGHSNVVCCPSNVDETLSQEERTHEEYVMEITRRKTDAVLSDKLKGMDFVAEDYLVCGDCVVVNDNNEVYGKPASAEQALSWLHGYSGTCFYLVQALEVTHLATRRRVVGTERTTCWLDQIPLEGRVDYINDSGALGAAGGLIIEHPFIEPCIRSIQHGTKESIMGLSPQLIQELFQKLTVS
ncbi:Maf-like protein [Gregarina niphandrodes]|uniref:Maf-like protein n=1 Tax=Gregarina niphandrodes TaxID=110365 RepID=A0A023B1Z9_GRENI|nr:Maf-like protein [Gregarina niphandrodes]EZG50027.1 Maf-like protein [Gregarina niphandrodes]|eukprot:XP_011132031.1 Maf-like protein [Gregarina niphandrodes]